MAIPPNGIQVREPAARERREIGEGLPHLTEITGRSPDNIGDDRRIVSPRHAKLGRRGNSYSLYATIMSGISTPQSNNVASRRFMLSAI